MGPGNKRGPATNWGPGQLNSSPPWKLYFNPLPRRRRMVARTEAILHVTVTVIVTHKRLWHKAYVTKNRSGKTIARDGTQTQRSAILILCGAYFFSTWCLYESFTKTFVGYWAQLFDSQA